MSISQNRNASRMKTFRVTPAEDEFLLDAAKRKGVGISTFCRIAALEAAGWQSPDHGARPGIGPHTRAIGEILAAACIIQGLLRVTEASNSTGGGADCNGEILDACNRVIAAANDLIGDAS